MKQLICEMCGSSDLIKSEGLFVCQTCGCKYSVEEAKKMMIEGTVSVQGTVKIDNSEEYDNYVRLAKTAFEDCRFDSAYTAIAEALKTTPEDPFLLERQALVILCREPFDQSINGATENGMKRAVQLAEEKLSTDDLRLFADALVSDVGIVTKFLNKNFDDDISELKGQKTPVRTAADLFADLGRPQIVVAQNQRDDKLTQQHNAKIDAQISVIENRIRRLSKFKRQCSNTSESLMEIVRKRVTEQYWIEHAEEKKTMEEELARLEEQRKTLNEQIKMLTDKKRAIPAKAEWEETDNRCFDMQTRLASLGILKGKEKKELRAEIEQVRKKLEEIDARVKSQEREIDKELTPLYVASRKIEIEISKINRELKMNRN